MENPEQTQNVPLLEQKEETKTKLPFCIFLLCNGAVGTVLTLDFSCVGAGILTLTSAVGKVGWGMGLCLYLFFGRKFRRSSANV